VLCYTHETKEKKPVLCYTHEIFIAPAADKEGTNLDTSDITMKSKHGVTAAGITSNEHVLLSHELLR
jgi:hypothetical protein